jgi:hypothetical protein
VTGDQQGVLHARPIGHMHTGLEGSYAGPQRWCERCGARLRQQNHGTKCAPCSEAAAEPYTPPTTPVHRCQWCSRAYTREHPNQLRYCSPTCRNSARKARERVRKFAAYKRSKNTPETRTRNHLGQFTSRATIDTAGQYG